MYYQFKKPPRGDAGSEESTVYPPFLIRTGVPTWGFSFCSMVNPEQSLEPDQAAPTAIGKYEVHPLANFFPILEGDQRDKLEQDIKEHGQQTDVVLFEGKILDGRNRALICERLGLKIIFVHFEKIKTSKSALDYVFSANLHRRHLTDKERSDLAVKRVKQIEEERANLVSPNSGNMFPLADERGQGKKGPAAIAAAQTGLTKQAVNKAVAREKNRSKTREEAIAKVPTELRDEVLKEARQRRPGVSTATTIDVPTAASIDHAHRRVQAARAPKVRLPEQIPERMIRRCLSSRWRHALPIKNIRMKTNNGTRIIAGHSTQIQNRREHTGTANLKTKNPATRTRSTSPPRNSPAFLPDSAGCLGLSEFLT
jgi:hypothetical protein